MTITRLKACKYYYLYVYTILVYYVGVCVCRWFFGKISRADAEKLLLQTGNQTGTYLIRESEGHYSLSVRKEDLVNHYRIREANTGMFEE